MKEIELTQGQVAIVDDDDFEDLSLYKWFAKKEGGIFYAARSYGAKRNTMKMHIYIMKPVDGFVIDHINGNGLDNRKSNLRICSHAENMRNRKLHKDNSSGYKGVSKNKGKYVARIMQIYLGRYNNAIDAARAYDAKARELFGNFAKLNFLDE